MDGNDLLRELFRQGIESLEHKQPLDVVLIGALLERLQDYCGRYHEHPLEQAVEARVCYICSAYIEPL